MVDRQVIYLGAGCFWCVESIYQRLKGVLSVSSGYMGGHIDNPTYDAVCSGTTGHVEVIEVVYDSSVIDTNTILEVFWHMHDPTTPDQQGADRGTQYRSAIFYTTDEQHQLALDTRETVASTIWKNPVVTQISAATTYFKAEDYHQNYYNLHSNQSYCTYVIYPKLAKLQKSFPEQVQG